jgi:hypothetical protein
MDDARIKELTEEVLGALYRRGPGEPGAPGGPASALEARVATLEARLQQLQGGAPGQAQGACATSVTAVAVAAPNSTATAVVNAQIATHPALQLLNVGGSTDGRCVLDADKPCVGSGACRTFGH